MPELPGPCDIETAARKGFLYAILSVEESMNERHERCKDAGTFNAHLLQTDKCFADLLLPFVVPYSISMHINTNSYFRNTGKFCSSLHFYEALPYVVLHTTLVLICYVFQSPYKPVYYYSRGRLLGPRLLSRKIDHNFFCTNQNSP